MSAKNKVAPEPESGAISKAAANYGRLTNTDPQETSVVLQAHPTAGKKVCDSCNRLPIAARAGTNRQDKISQRKTRKFSWL